MKCPKCGGNGKEYWNGNVFCNTGFECDKCNGTGEIEVEMTNEEWFCTLPTEEKAKIFHKIFMVRTFCHICPDGGVCDIGYKCKYHEGEVEDFVMWLKQPHKGVAE